MHAEVVERTLMIDGAPRVVLAGEIHPFRLQRDGWARRLRLLREAGADTVAAYIPWVVHEQADGTIDLDGHVRPELDLGGFLDLVAEHGLRFLARPGPFTMGELRHEGVPGRIVREHPELRPIGWGSVPAPTSDLDVANPVFLAEADRWYAALGPVLAPRVADGTVTGVQLDNEIGMLSWVSNTPVLTDDALTELRERVGGSGSYPAAAAPLAAWRTAIRTPSPAIAPDLRVDLAELHRDRAARYIAALQTSAERHGFGGVPCYVNVHGTEAGSARSMAIGISQLQRAYRGRPGVVAGSDHYVGTLDFAGAADLHLVHAYLAASAPDQPLTSLEHEAGTGDYGGDLAEASAPEATEQKTRLLLGQGARLFNWYLFAGGTNFEDPRPEDVPGGGHRFGITGERHGAAAPVTPEGEPSSAYAPTARAMAAAARLPEAASWEPETDGIVVGFVPSAFATEHLHPADVAGRELVSELRWARSGGPDAILPRVLLASGFRFGAVDLEHAAVSDLAGRVLVLGTGDVLDDGVQRLVAEHVWGGGGLLLLGDLPMRDLRGRPCSVLADALGLRRRDVVRGGPAVRPAIRPVGFAEVHVERLSHLDAVDADVLVVDALTGDPCGVEVRLGRGRAIVIAAAGPADPAFYRAALERLDAAPAFEAEGAAPGLVLQTTRTPEGARFLHLLDVGGFGQRVVIRERGDALFGGAPIDLAPRGGVVLRLE